MHLFAYGFGQYSQFTDSACESTTEASQLIHADGSWFQILDMLTRIPVNVSIAVRSRQPC